MRGDKSSRLSVCEKISCQIEPQRPQRRQFFFVLFVSFVSFVVCAASKWSDFFTLSQNSERVKKSVVSGFSRTGVGPPEGGHYRDLKTQHSNLRASKRHSLSAARKRQPERGHLVVV